MTEQHWTLHVVSQADRSVRERIEPTALVESAPAPKDPRPCRSTLPGHQMHWLTREQAESTVGVPVTRVVVHGIDLEIHLESGEVLFWRHHDPSQIAEAIDAETPPRIAAHPQHTSLEIGTAWFNCADASWPWQPCRAH